MSNIVDLSELQNFTDVLDGVKIGSPVFLAHDDTKRYVIVDIEDYNRMRSSIKLLSELAQGRMSVKAHKAIPIDEVMRDLGIVE